MTRHDIYQSKPASAFCHRWRDATPLGNGLTGVLLYGGSSEEQVVISRHDMWHASEDKPVPDVSAVLAEMRELHKNGKDAEACNRMYEELSKHGYDALPGRPRVLGCVRFALGNDGIYNRYRRITHMDTGEVEISYRLDTACYRRGCFVSRKRDIIVMGLQNDAPISFTATPGFFNSYEVLEVPFYGRLEREAREQDAKFAQHRTEQGCVIYSSKLNGKYFGAVVKVISDGEVITGETSVSVKQARDTLVLIKAFSEAKNRKAAENAAIKALLNCPQDYITLLTEHKRLHKRLYDRADIRLYGGRKFHSNEELLADVRENECSPELAEKLWRFGRYLFISGVHKNGQPFPLYGLWNAGYGREWSQHVANENVQSIHWHACVGGLSELVRPLIRYYYEKMDPFRENARQLYGCSGIFASAYSTPNNSAITPHVPVIIHFLGVAGWLSQHFYQYYLFTHDETLFETEILPFMLETAAFYEDFVYTDENGMIELYPAVSPENSPGEYHNVGLKTYSGHPMPVTKNPTIEFAILKELLTNLVSVCKDRPDMQKRVSRWKDMLSRIPDYLVNEDGAIAEWMDPSVHDWYPHRHLSHIYPFFPGTEIEDTGRTDLIPAFKKAVDNRVISSLCGWSLPHMAAIYARLKEGQKLFDCLNMTAKVILLDNLFTMSNDYRGMGITTTGFGNETFAPVQLDAQMGTVNAMQEMLLFVSPKRVKLLQACPAQFPKGSALLHYCDGTVKLQWNLQNQICRAVFTASRQTDITVELPFDKGERHLVLAKGERAIIEI